MEEISSTRYLQKPSAVIVTDLMSNVNSPWLKGLQTHNFIMSYFCNFFPIPFMTSLLPSCYHVYNHLKVWEAGAYLGFAFGTRFVFN